MTPLRRLAAALVASSLAMIGCSQPVDDEVVSNGAAISNRASTYTVPVGADYDFCLAPVMPGPDDEVYGDFEKLPLPNLDNVRTLAHFSDVAYWPPERIGPELARLGFGARGEGQILAQCARDAAAVRASRAREPMSSADLGACAREWLEGHPGGSANDFLGYVERETHPDRSLEFFSTGFSVGAEGKSASGHTQVVWAQHRTEPWVVIAFRGTEFLEDARDVWTDANFPTVPFSAPGWGRVHGGFDGAYRTASALLEARLAKLPRGTHVWVTGHSLGGALASIFAAELLTKMERGVPIRFDGLVTYGSPRVGDTAFFEHAERAAAKHRVALHRVQNVSNDRLGYDPVVHVPFRSTFGESFGHVGAPLQLYPNGNVTYGADPSRLVEPLPLLRDVIASFRERVAEGLTQAFPHFLARYGERIDDAIQSGRERRLRQCGPRRASR
ncbi:MAG: lipase family protein [Deltaproteobacteria bacterium]|nr:lipase family protein [Deltaproteobacteria bacterium]